MGFIRRIKSAVSNVGKSVGNAVKNIGKTIAAVGLAVGVGYMLFSGLGSLGFFGRSFLVNAGLSLLAGLFNRGGSGDGAQQSLQNQGKTQFFRETVAPHSIVYGKTRTSGPLVYVEGTGENNKFLHLVIVFAAHRVEEFESFYLNNDIVTLDGNGFVTDSRWVSGGTKLIRIRSHLGSNNQAADSVLVSESGGKWTSNHRLQGLAYAYVRLEFNADKFADGIPQISAVIKGKRVYNSDSGVTEWTDNPVWCLRDYLTDTQYGLGALEEEIDDAYFLTAATVCDDSINLNGGGSENRYTINGVLSTQQSPKSNIEAIIGTMAGQFWYSEGQFRVNAAKWREPVLTLTEDDLAGPVSIQTRNSRRDIISGVKGVHISAADKYQQVDYPPISSETFVTVDNDVETRFRELPLPLTVTTSMAQRIARYTLYRAREQLSVKLQCGMVAFELQVGDVFRLQFDKLGYTAEAAPKYFEVTEWQLLAEPEGLSIAISATEISEAVFAWNVDEKIFEQNNLSVPVESVPAAPSLSVDDELRAFNENALTVLFATGSTSDPFHFEYEAEFRKSGAAEFSCLGKAIGNRFEAVNVEDNAIYNVRMRSVSQLGRFSPWAEVDHQVIGKLEPPQDVLTFGSNPVGDTIVLS